MAHTRLTPRYITEASASTRLIDEIPRSSESRCSTSTFVSRRSGWQCSHCTSFRVPVLLGRKPCIGRPARPEYARCCSVGARGDSWASARTERSPAHRGAGQCTVHCPALPLGILESKHVYVPEELSALELGEIFTTYLGVESPAARPLVAGRPIPVTGVRAGRSAAAHVTRMATTLAWPFSKDSPTPIAMTPSRLASLVTPSGQGSPAPPSPATSSPTSCFLPTCPEPAQHRRPEWGW
eukprot:scaffold2678_cov140-Isochrysis_galbana.AAC.3